MIEVRVTGPGGQVEWVPLPISRTGYTAVRAQLKTLHDALDHAHAFGSPTAAALGKSDTWFRHCSPQSEGPALILRNKELFPAEIVALVAEGTGVRHMFVCFALTISAPKIRKAHVG